MNVAAEGGGIAFMGPTGRKAMARRQRGYAMGSAVKGSRSVRVWAKSVK
jgi:hypothetical protein